MKVVSFCKDVNRQVYITLKFQYLNANLGLSPTNAWCNSS